MEGEAGSQGSGEHPPASVGDLVICSWNINGLRRFETGNPKAGLNLRECFKQLGAAIICFQETKLLRSDLTEDLALLPGFHSFFSFSQLRANGGYSGVATYVKTSAVRTVGASEGLRGCCGSVPVQACPLNCVGFMERWQARIGSTDVALLDELEQEGRVVITDHDGFVLLNVYMPASREGREEFKKAFHEAFKLRVEALVEAGRQVVVLGDLNAVVARIDHCDPDPTEFENKFTVRWMQSLLAPQPSLVSDSPTPATRPPLLVDTYRTLHPTQPGAYTCWNTQTGARKTNYGTRIDYILVTPELSKQLKSAAVRQEVEGSDHCPVTATFRGIPQGAEQLDPAAPPPALAAAYMFRAKQSKLHAFLLPGRGQANEGDSAQQQPEAEKEEEGQQAASSSDALPVSSDESSRPTSPSAPPPSHSTTFMRRNPAAPGGYDSKKGGRARKQLRLDYFCVAKAVTAEVGEQQPQQVATEEVAVSTTISVQQAEAAPASADPALPAAPTSSSSSSTAASSSSSKWKALFKPPPIPKCHHKEPAVERVVIKDGDNKGRRFFVCARPAGAPSHPLSRCDFFQWASEPKRFVGQPPPPAQQGMPGKRKR